MLTEAQHILERIWINHLRIIVEEKQILALGIFLTKVINLREVEVALVVNHLHIFSLFQFLIEGEGFLFCGIIFNNYIFNIFVSRLRSMASMQVLNLQCDPYWESEWKAVDFLQSHNAHRRNPNPLPW